MKFGQQGVEILLFNQISIGAHCCSRHKCPGHASSPAGSQINVAAVPVIFRDNDGVGLRSRTVAPEVRERAGAAVGYGGHFDRIVGAIGRGGVGGESGIKAAALR